PQWLSVVIARLHAKKPADRFGSAKDVADLLGRRLVELELHGQVRPIGNGSSLVDAARKPNVPPAKQRRRWLGGIAALCLGLLAVLWFFVWRHDDRAAQVQSGHVKAPPPSIPNARQARFDAWLKEVAGLAGAEQVEAVAAKLQELNPGFDGNVTSRIVDE